MSDTSKLKSKPFSLALLLAARHIAAVLSFLDLEVILDLTKLRSLDANLLSRFSAIMFSSSGVASLLMVLALNETTQTFPLT